jgi:uncharacterized protein
LGIVCLLLMFLMIGIPLLFLLLIATLVMPIIAIANIVQNPDRSYRYPLIFRFI